MGLDLDATVERVQLDEHSWVDVTRGWLADAEEVFGVLLDTVPWQASKLFRYDHVVEERRLGAMWQRGMPLPHEALAEATRSLQQRYRVVFEGFGLIQYRDGKDGQAFHRDTDMKWLDDTVVAVLTLGQRRPWLLRPWANKNRDLENKGATHDLSPGPGDLIVMGGRAQADWQHSVPYRPTDQLGVRISIQWRFAHRRGKPFVGSSYRAPLHYGRS